MSWRLASIDRFGCGKFAMFGMVVACIATVVPALAQQSEPAPASDNESQADASTATPQSAQRGEANSNAESTPPSPSSAQLDREWLTAYMLTEHGYRLHHLPALDDAFGKMTPSQLSVLRKLHEEKHRMALEQQALAHRAQELQIAIAALERRRQELGGAALIVAGPPTPIYVPPILPPDPHAGASMHGMPPLPPHAMLAPPVGMSP